MRGLLEAEGISTQVRSMDLWGVAVEIYFAEGARPSVWVRDHDTERASQVLAESDRRGTAAPWACRRNNEPLEGQFTTCWRCGQERHSA